MKEGETGRAATLPRQPSGTAFGGSSGSRSHSVALDTTACLAEIVLPSRSRTPARQPGGVGRARRMDWSLA